MFTVYSQSQKRYFKARLWTCACAFHVASIIALVIVPFVLAYITGSFWSTESIHVEQPKVAFEKKIIMFLEGEKNGNPFQMMWTPYPHLNELFGDTLRIPTISSLEIDLNVDGKTDYLDISLVVPLNQGEGVSRAQLLTFLDYQLNDKAKFQMEGAVYFDSSSARPGNSLTYFGDLKLRQAKGLKAWGSTYKPFAFEPLFDEFNMTSIEEFSPVTVLGKLHKRNFTTYISAPQALWSTASPSIPPVPFTLNAKLRIPSERVRVIPSAFEALKFGWIQYFAILWPLLRLVGWWKGIVFEQRVLHCLSRRSSLVAVADGVRILRRSFA